jgi:5-methylcytosine-specific restriction protein A
MLYYHHVGQEGAALDFEKTIFSEIKIADIKRFIPPNQVRFQHSFYRHFSTDCTDGTVCCWGVPKGAFYKIEGLIRGDWVLLIESLQAPYILLCEVIAYRHEEFRSLSNFLWNTNRYPYIFFLDYEFISKSWSDFLRIIGYSIDYNPRGLFLNVDSEVIRKNGGIGNILNRLKQ